MGTPFLILIALAITSLSLPGAQPSQPWPAGQRTFSLALQPSTPQAVAVGHQYREDDLPALAVGSGGSVWVAWLSFAGDRDDLALRRYQDGRWENLQWVPNTSGDSWAPQLAVDSRNRVWIVWSQQLNGNWDIWARFYDPSTQRWGPAERLTDHPLPDINPQVAADPQGRLAVAWQGFRDQHSNIFLRQFDGDRWLDPIRVTDRAANDWEPSVAFGPDGTLWVAYDSYKNGNYDVFLRRVRANQVEADEIPVANSPRFEARASIAVDRNGRVWVAWESGPVNWGKDQGYVTQQGYLRRDGSWGSPLAGQREPMILCWDHGRWRAPAQPLAEAFPSSKATYQPQVFSDGRGSVWVVAKPRFEAEKPEGTGGYWEYWVTHYEGDHWAPARALPNSKGRLSTRAAAALDPQGGLWLAWSTDNRREGYYHRPIRQQVYVARLDPPQPPASFRWAESQLAEELAPPTHPNELADVAAIRNYTVEIRGRKLSIVRGDFHRHTELSWDGGGRNDGSLQDFYRYMIDAAAMDFGASTDHQGGAWPYWWWYTVKMADMYHVPGRFVPFFGYERSVVYPNGHRNVFFVSRSQARVIPFHLKDGLKNFMLPLGPQGDEPGVGTGDVVDNDTKLLYESLRGKNAILIPHTSATRMGTDWRDNDPELEPVVEIFQGCRTNYERADAPLAAQPDRDAAHIKRAGYHADGFVSNAWAKGYKLGVITSSDHGSTHISYAMVYTSDFSRQGILEAIRQRHTYGAMDNIILDVRMGEHFMGDEFRLDRPEPIRVRVIGTQEITRVVIVKDNQVIYSTEPGKKEVDFTFRDTSDVTGRHFYYVRVEQADRLLAWSSPFFVNY